MDVVPLYIAAIYANATFDGIGPGQYWADKPTNNLTAISERMRIQVTDANAIYQYRTPFEVLVSDRYPGSNFALYNVGQLFLDIHANPSQYLNGTTPLMVNSYVHAPNGTLRGDPDSFMWYDELHPSQQTQRWVASTFMDVINGNSSYATYYSS
jgi:hypothetical protein